MFVIGRFGIQSDSPASTRASSGTPLSPLSLDFHSAPMSPVDMMDDERVPPNDRVSTLERTVDEIRSQGEANQALLQDLLSKLGPVLAPPVNAPTETRPPATV